MAVQTTFEKMVCEGFQISPHLSSLVMFAQVDREQNLSVFPDLCRRWLVVDQEGKAWSGVSS